MGIRRSLAVPYGITFGPKATATFFEGASWVPERLIDQLGPDYFHTITVVHLSPDFCCSDPWYRGPYDSRNFDPILTQVACFSQLLWLNISHSSIVDVNLSQLQQLSNLRRLDLNFTAVSDAGLSHLKELDKLSKLDVRDTQVTDAGVKELQRALPNLKITR